MNDKKLHKLYDAAGWTLVRNQYELTKFEVEHYISYRRRPASFPCLVQDRITSDENSETYILTTENLHDMVELLNTDVGHEQNILDVLEDDSFVNRTTEQLHDKHECLSRSLIHAAINAYRSAVRKRINKESK